jgi:hypothetical protein
VRCRGRVPRRRPILSARPDSANSDSPRTAWPRRERLIYGALLVFLAFVSLLVFQLWQRATQNRPAMGGKRTASKATDAPSPPGLRTRGDTPLPPAGDEAPEEGSPDAAASPIQAWIEVRATCNLEEEFQTYVRAYVLDAGAPGAAGTDRVPHATLEMNQGPERIPLLKPGRYDVGAVCDWGRVLVRDVEVAAGAVVPVELRFEKPGLVQVRLHDPWPPKTPGLRAWVELLSEHTQNAYAAPGRGEPFTPYATSLLWGELQGVLVVPGVTYRPVARMVRPVPGHATYILRMHPGTPGLLLEPTAVRAGTQVQVGFPELIEVEVRVRPKPGWPERETTTLNVIAEGADESWSSTFHWYRPFEPTALPKELGESIRLLVPDSVQRLRWTGSQIVAGATEVLERARLAAGPVDIPIAFAWETVADLERLGVEVRPASERRATGVRIVAWGGGGEPALVQQVLPTGEQGGRAQGAAPRHWRRRGWIQAFTKDGQISDPVRIPQVSEVRLPLQVGGFVRLRNAEVFPDELGDVVLSRTDGLPFFEDREASFEEYTVEDKILGPFLPGPLALALRAGPVAVRTYTLNVVAGETVDLDLRP